MSSAGDKRTLSDVDVAELEARLAAANERAAAANARAEREAERADVESKARVKAENTDKARVWLFTLVEDGASFASHVVHACAHHTPRHASSSIGSSVPAPPSAADEQRAAEIAAELLVCMMSPGEVFWSTLPAVDDATIDRVCSAVLANKPLRDAFNAVMAARAESGKAAEVDLVHPLAHALFSVIVDAVPAVSVHLYKEKKKDTPVDAAQSRLPDLLLYWHAGGGATRFNACVQRHGLLSIELKSVLDSAHKKLAVVELLRDYAHTVGDGVEETKPTFFGLMGDGVNWIATRWQTKVSSVDKPFSLQESTTFTLDLDVAASVRTFVERFLRLYAAAAARPTHKTGWSIAPLVLSGERFECMRVLGVTTSCVVVECRDGRGSVFALKIARPSDRQGRCAMEVTVRSALLSGATPPTQIAVCSAVEFFGVAPVLHIETVGTVLERMCLCDASQREALARMVLRDVSVALNGVHARNLAFVDLHPGNVIVVGNSAYLIDLESCSELGVKTSKPIRAAFRTLPASDAPTVETDQLGLLLVLAWILDVDSFRTTVARNESREAGASAAQALLDKYTSLEAFVERHL